ncbi:MAG: hypothetical protein EAZ07_02535 [Cytophagales bacterium]|nr:MAG: hypothetical protein EAZ07_02535 [Cytophagales bacterium]
MILKKYFDNPFILSNKSVSAMRIAVALCLLIDLLIRSTDLEAHYSDRGVLPLELLFQYGWLPSYFSIYNIFNSPFLIGVVFAIHIVAALSLLLGYKTRWSSLFAWILLVSLHNRNHLVHQGADDLLRMLLFWGIFLPWGNHFSIDSKLTNSHQSEKKFSSIATAGYIFLVFSMYFFSALLKNGADWTKDFSALYYAYQLDMIVLPLGKWLSTNYTLLQTLTFITYYIELVLPFVLFIPLVSNYFRYLFLLIIIGLHIGISSTLFVGIFPLVSICALVGLAPEEFWNTKWIVRISNFARFGLINKIAHYFTIPPKDNNIGYYNKNVKLKNTLITWCLGFLLFLSTYKNYEGVGEYEIKFLNIFNPIVEFLRIDQRWGMFAPIVFRDDGWFIFEGTTIQEKKQIDIYNQGNVINYNKPESVVSKVKNDRWRKYQENILFVSQNIFRPKYCQWLIKSWNQGCKPNQQIYQLKIIYIKEVSKPDYKSGETSKEVLCDCVF